MSTIKSKTNMNKSEIPCRFNKKDIGCTNLKCSYKHEDGRSPEDNLEKRKKSRSEIPCRFNKKDTGCTNLKCPYKHENGRSPEE